MTKLPKSLEREPLVDAVFEMRLVNAPPLADILPGALFSALKPRSGIQRLPAFEIPSPMRAQDPGLQFAPLLRLELDKFFLSVGDSNIVLSCKLPYPKWPSFKAFIVQIVKEISKINIGAGVERYSLKYVNLIQSPTISDQLKRIRTNIQLGDVKVKSEHVSLQVHHAEDDILHILSVVTGAQARMPDGKEMFGTVVDIDSIRAVNFPDFRSFAEAIENDVEALRIANKVKFFNCLTRDAIVEMGPTYE